MGKFKWLACVCFMCLCLSCKKNTDLDGANITVQNLYVKSIKSDRVDISYELSRLGYQETGVSFNKKSEPEKTSRVKAVREDGILKLSLQGLEPGTEYVFRVFYKHNDSEELDAKDYLVKTLSSKLAKFALELKNSKIECDKNGNFTAEVEGENLNNLNLSKLAISLNNTPLHIDYPIQIEGNRYKIVIKGSVEPGSTGYFLSGLYESQQIIFQSVQVAFNGEVYWLSYKKTNLRAYYPTVFNNDLYYFIADKVVKWDEQEQRFIPIGTGNIGEENLIGYENSIQFKDQIFVPTGKKLVGNWETPSYYPLAYSYSPGSDSWDSFAFKDKTFSGETRDLTNNQLFIHNDELYLAFGILDNYYVKKPGPADNYIYRYNRSTKQFTEAGKLGKEISNYHYISINNQLYIVGLSPVYDQGIALNSTFCIYKVDDQSFEMEEIYRGGTVYDPLTLVPKNVAVYDQMILIAFSIDNFMLFDPNSRRLSQIYLKNSISGMYYGKLFTYNNTLHLGVDMLSYEAKVYELSISKGQ